MSIDELFLAVESAIHDYHGAQLAHWTINQKRVLQSAAELDTDALQAQRGIVEETLRLLKQDLKKHKDAREEQETKLQDALDNCEDEFLGQIRIVGDEQCEESAQVIADAQNALQENAEKWIDSQWDHFDANMRAIVWKHAKLVQGAGLAEGMAQLYQQGEIQKHLEAEKKGWSESQEQDLNLLQSEIAKEHEDVFQDLAHKLKDLSPNKILFDHRTKQVGELARADHKRLTSFEQEVRTRYEPQIIAALAQADATYKDYDLQLQEVLLRTLKKRFADAAHMRQLKLALCRWRLDYQRVFHDTCKQLSGVAYAGTPPPPPPPGRTQQQHTAKQFDTVRKMVLDLWTKNNTPNSEIQRFLDKVMDSIAKDGRADSLTKVYRQELKQYGALPLLELSERPDLIECYLESLRSANENGGPSRPAGHGRE
mmetsp:Transcript_4730/g.11245  ORF Transcript_4730/g.11245 Transcript_4730/m.11245 type:complete len:426 (-) Transcript_4730:240-1517(-)